MNEFTDEGILIACALLAVAVLLTPVAGIWIWLAIGIGLWISGQTQRILGIG
ncbi:MAG: hypothetical protein QM775_09500 [Pirellulales bacterium]